MCYECAYKYITQKLVDNITVYKHDNLSKSLYELLEHANDRVAFHHIKE